ncbi:hypothetical protein K474DRAFT_1603501 [Panus rudis PR-1116 ss-1]|nr:hypothetical protein K474DRAFT_1603501 [Panus rudis PR-1116 ss-1]
MSIASDETLSKLFTIPTKARHASSALVPPRQAGVTPESAKAVLDLLKVNHRQWYLFFDNDKFHNHVSHHLIGAYGLGANKELLNTIYKTHSVFQRPAEVFKSPGPIDATNWKEHVGDDRYYYSYFEFFAERLLKKGVDNVFAEYIFSKDANFVPATPGGKPAYMLSRYLGGLAHPLIHTGYGAEFEILGMWAEGLAEACVDHINPTDLIPPSLFEAKDDASLLSKFDNLTLSSTQEPKKTTSPHALTILGRILADPSFTPVAIGIPSGKGFYPDLNLIVEKVGEKLRGFLEEWVTEPTKESLEEKTEELIWMNVLIYAAAGEAGKDRTDNNNGVFKADFFLMHLVTSVVFLPSLSEHLSLHNTSILLRGYLVTSLLFYLIRGRPALPVADFYKATKTEVVPPGPQPTPNHTINMVTPAGQIDPKKIMAAWAPVTKILYPNPWYPVLQTAFHNPEEHFLKTQRALAHFASVLGLTPPGTFAHLSSEGLGGLDVLDGTLFVRTAIATANRLGWMREGEVGKSFDRISFY